MASHDSEDEDLKAAIAMSLAMPSSTEDLVPAPESTIKQESRTSNTEDTALALNTTRSSFAGLDRKAMEAERLARLNRKRERSISPPPGRRKALKIEETAVSLPSGAMLKSFSTVVDADQRSRKSNIANAATDKLKTTATNSTIAVKQEPSYQHHIESKPSPSLQGSLKYPTGVVKKTWAFRFERTPNDIKLEEVLEPQTLRTAVLSAFQFDVEWVLSKLKTPQNGGSTKCIFVMEAKTEELRKQMLEDVKEAEGWLRLCFPPMYQPIFCMHSKLMLLFHPDKLRIAVPTANLLNFDWGETGNKENSVFMIDLPRLPNGGKVEISNMTAFGKELLYFIRRMKLDRDVRDGVLNFDFSATKDMMFVHTVGGSHYDEEAERTGLPGLARAVRQLGLQSQEDLQIDFAASSIGSLNDEYLKSVHAAARGEDMLARVEAAVSKDKADFFKAKLPREAGLSIREQIRIYFPLHETVISSIAGTTGTVCLNRKWFESTSFPRECFRDYRSRRTGLLSHNKILYARGKAKQDKADPGLLTEQREKKNNIAWAYIGSANMSESAWGKLSLDKKEKKWKIVCRNWECGVLLPVPAEKLAAPVQEIKKEKIEGEDSETESEDEDGQGEGKEDVIGIEVFDGLVEPPFEIPGARYGDREPWYFMERSS